MPIAMTAVFLLYLLYLLMVKKNLKQKADKVVYPGLFFVVAWIAIYVAILA